MTKQNTVNSARLSRALELAQSQVRQGQTETARATYKNVLQQFPENIEATEGLKSLQDVFIPDEQIIADPPLEQLQYFIDLRLQGQLRQAQEYAEALIKNFPNSAILHNMYGSLHADLRQHKRAIECYQNALEIKPDYSAAYYNLGTALKAQGQLGDAIKSYQMALNISADHVKASFDLSTALQNLGDLDGAIASFRRTLEIKPDYVEASCNLGIVLQRAGDLDGAVNTYQQALAKTPDHIAVLNNLGSALKQKGDIEGAIECYRKIIEIDHDYAPAQFNLSVALHGFQFDKPQPNLISVLEVILDNKAGGRPKSFAQASISLVKFELPFQAVSGSYASGRFDRSVLEIIADLSKISLLLQLMALYPLPDLELEILLKTIRREILLGLRSISVTPELLRFQQALALQCFTNEYIYECSDAENEVLKLLEQEVEASLQNDQQPDPVVVACLASYRALYQYDWWQLLVLPEDLFELGQRQIQEPLEEQRLRTELPTLQEVTDEVSSAVRDQYEEHPYPRWVKCNQHPNPISIKAFLKRQHLRFSDTEIADISEPSVLIAGCGTGQHPIETAAIFKDCHVLAIDLSLSSLAYAQRKTTEMGLTNIEYMQADILDLKKLERQFDVIESVGVLHHMDDPMAGWRVLTDCLKPGGLMRIGLYSELARQHIVQIRDEIQELGLQPNESDMKWFRKTILDSDKQHHRLIIQSADLYSLSSYRDLLFHVQEHRFTIPQIQNGLATLGLQFSGFGSTHFIPGFRQSNPNVEDLYDLSKWQAYEENSLGTFAGMYQFWCQRAHD